MKSSKKPVLLLQSRPEDHLSDNEFEMICQVGGIPPEQVERLRMEQDDLPPNIDLTKYSAVILGGGPANFANDESQKSGNQKRFEDWLIKLMQRIIAEDKPFLGLCLGVGAVAIALGVKPDFSHGEEVKGQEIHLTELGKTDPLLKDLPEIFYAVVGHKEGIPTELPYQVLAVSDTCAQITRTGSNVYATQYHPELDQSGLELRVRAYQNDGYFKPEEIEHLLAQAAKVDISHAPTILVNFSKKYIL